LLVEESSTISLKGLPWVSTGKNITATPAATGTAEKRETANPCWQLLTKSTATNGHTRPPTLAIAFAIPNPVERLFVGYTCRQEPFVRNGIADNTSSHVGSDEINGETEMKQLLALTCFPKLIGCTETRSTLQENKQ
jgi:hypothetical protein